MTFTFIPKTEEEILYERLLAEGEYYFEVIECEERKTPKSEFFRIKLKLISTFDNRSYVRHDNITLHPSYIWRLLHACKEMGILEFYQRGQLSADDFLNRQGSLIVAHRRNKDSGILEDYIKDYGVKKPYNSLEQTAMKEYDTVSPNTSNNNFLDDDIPNFT